jgi:hypothetical protein
MFFMILQTDSSRAESKPHRKTSQSGKTIVDDKRNFKIINAQPINRYLRYISYLNKWIVYSS